MPAYNLELPASTPNALKELKDRGTIHMPGNKFAGNMDKAFVEHE